MRSVILRQFKNEYGNTIRMSGLIYMGDPGICEHIRYKIGRPESTDEQKLTVKEAQALRDLLIEMVGAP